MKVKYNKYYTMKTIKKAIKIFLTGLVALVLTPACTDLDEEVFSVIPADDFLTTPEQFVSAVGSAYGPLTTWARSNTAFGAQ